MLFLGYKAIKEGASVEAKLMNRKWCLEYVVYRGIEYIPNTVSGKYSLTILGKCNSKLKLKEEGVIELPGFESRAIQGNWEIKNDSITIYNTDTMSQILEGMYAIELDRNRLTLQSDSIQMFCSLRD